MGAILLTTAIVLALLEAALVGLLFVPVDVAVSARAGRRVRYRVRWLFGLVRVSGGAPRRESTPPQEPPHPAEESRPLRRRRAARAWRRFRRLRAIDGLLPRVVRLARELIRGVSLRRGRLWVRAGTGDPAGTGELCGLIYPWLPWRPRRLQVEFEPDFTEAVLEAEAEGVGRVVPARVVGALGRFAVSGPGRRAIMVMMWNGGR